LECQDLLNGGLLLCGLKLRCLLRRERAAAQLGCRRRRQTAPGLLVGGGVLGVQLCERGDVFIHLCATSALGGLTHLHRANQEIHAQGWMEAIETGR
jgi:hypothetical protein